MRPVMSQPTKAHAGQGHSTPRETHCHRVRGCLHQGMIDTVAEDSVAFASHLHYNEPGQAGSVNVLQLTIICTSFGRQPWKTLKLK